MRGVLHIKDAVESIIRVMAEVGKQSLYQVAGGMKNSTSLMELTKMAQQISGHNVPIESISQTHKNDVPILLLDGKSSYESLGLDSAIFCTDGSRDTYQVVK